MFKYFNNLSVKDVLCFCIKVLIGVSLLVIIFIVYKCCSTPYVKPISTGYVVSSKESSVNNINDISVGTFNVNIKVPENTIVTLKVLKPITFSPMHIENGESYSTK